MGKYFKLILLSLVLMYPLCVVTNVEANPVRQYMEIDRADLKLLIGEKLYNQPGDGCWSCPPWTNGATGVSRVAWQHYYWERNDSSCSVKKNKGPSLG